MVFGLMDKLLASGTICETGVIVFARPNVIELKNLHRAGIWIDRQGAEMGLFYYSIHKCVMLRIKVIHVRTSECHHLVPSKGDSLEQHGQQMGTLAGTRLSMCLKPQQTAEMNTPH